MNNVFYVVCIRGDEKKFLCHGRFFLQPYESSDVDRSKILVHDVPANVMIRISGRPAYCPSDEDVAAADLPVWQAGDLRAGLCDGVTTAGIRIQERLRLFSDCMIT